MLIMIKIQPHPKPNSGMGNMKSQLQQGSLVSSANSDMDMAAAEKDEDGTIGIVFLVDFATIKRMPLLNILGSPANTPPVVLEVKD